MRECGETLNIKAMISKKPPKEQVPLLMELKDILEIEIKTLKRRKALFKKVKP